MEDNKNVETENELAHLLSDAWYLIGFVWRSIMRHRIMIGAVLFFVVGLSIALIQVLPITYRVSASILTHPSGKLIDIRPYEERNSSIELIRSRGNIKSIVKDLNLVDSAQKNRSPLGKIRAYIFSFISDNSPTEEQLLDGVTDYFYENFSVWSEGNVVTFNVIWRDAKMAFLIAEKLVNNYLEDQLNQEDTGYLVNIETAKMRLARADEILSDAEQRYREIYNKDKIPIAASDETDRKPPKVLSPKIEPEPTSAAVQIGEDIEDLERELNLKRRETELLQQTYLQRVNEAKSRLAELQLTMGPQHPEVIKAEQLVKLLSSPPPSIEKIRSEQETILARITKAKELAAAASSTTMPTIRRGRPSAVSAVSREQKLSIEDEEKLEEYTRAKIARNTAEEALLNANIQYEAAKSALKYRFQVTQPPRMPTGPSGPKTKLIIIGAIVAGLFLGAFLSVFADLKTGLILETWQVSRVLGIPVLGELDESDRI